MSCEYCVGGVVYTFEKLAICVALSIVVSGVVLLLIFSVTVGVGIGYYYEYLQKHIELAEKIRRWKFENQHLNLKTDNPIKRAEDFIGTADVTPSIDFSETSQNIDVNGVEDPHISDERVKRTLTRKKYVGDGYRVTLRQKRSGVNMIVPISPQTNISSLISKIMSKGNLTVEFVKL